MAFVLTSLLASGIHNVYVSFSILSTVNNKNRDISNGPTVIGHSRLTFGQAIGNIIRVRHNF